MEQVLTFTDYMYLKTFLTNSSSCDVMMEWTDSGECKVKLFDTKVLAVNETICFRMFAGGC